MKISPYDKIAEFYDEGMGKNSSGEDIVFYVQQCSPAQTPILELGCGTGRISLPLVKAGFEVVGIDASFPMLQQLQHKAVEQLSTIERKRLFYCQMDMSNCAFNACFDFIICPFSAFVYLVDKSSQTKALANIRSHLTTNGLFILDFFIPNLQMMALPDDHVFHDYERKLADGNILKRTKTIQKTALPNVNLITRNYYFLDENGKEKQIITTKEHIQYHFPNEFKNMLQQNGFEVLKILGDFREQPCDEKTSMAVIIAKSDKN